MTDFSTFGSLDPAYASRPTLQPLPTPPSRSDRPTVADHLAARPGDLARPTLRGFPQCQVAGNRPPQAFTLVELLVVIGIIALLISILLPALNRARQSAVSVQCMSNMKQVGQAALMYAHEFRGWFPPSQGDAFSGNNSDEKFLDYTDGTANRYIVRELMAKYCGYKVPVYPAPAGQTYVSPNTLVFNCPADDQLVSGVLWPDNNMLNHDPAIVGANGNNPGKFRYWWCANPSHPTDSATLATLAAAPYYGNDDINAARIYAHMDIQADLNTPQATSHPWFDTSISCKPGIDYLRKTSDKHATEVCIMTDRSKQKSATVDWYMMHGSSGPNSKKGWKNELFGDGHAESRRLDQMKEHWAPAAPQSW